MEIFITGGTGFVGTALSRYLLEQGHKITAVGTSLRHILESYPGFRYLSADTTRKGDWQDKLQSMDAVVNLAGKSIFRRWSKTHKRRMVESRILTTRNLVDALPVGREMVLCSTSAAGYYGNRADEVLREDAAPGEDFLAKLCMDWETEAFRAQSNEVRVVTMRFGVVLGRGGGALGPMIPVFRLFAGGPLGSGRQWFPWIHMDDLVSAVFFILNTPAMEGPVNFCSPGPVRQRDFAGALGKALHRPSFMPAPGFMIRLVMGELGQSFLNSQHVSPEKLIEHGFNFHYPDIDKALGNIVSQTGKSRRNLL